MASPTSPLRYPGGKQILTKVLRSLIEINGRSGCPYAEPYAGGAGAALSLLFSEHVSQLLLNDADRAIYCFWRSILNQTDEFLKALVDTPVSVDEWDRQRAIYARPSQSSLTELGFAAFYLNRCNRSGIIGNGGVIGGRDQRGTWKIDARYNRKTLASRVERIAMYSDRIKVFNLDAIDFLRSKVMAPDIAPKVFVYLDPPYFEKGSQLYLNHYSPEDHSRLAKYITGKNELLWVMTYDNVPEIRRLYRGLRIVTFNLSYSASTRRAGSELLIAPQELILPRGCSKKIPESYLVRK